MILRRLVAFPESKRILWMHMLATGLLAVQLGVMAMIPVLMRKQFAAGDWQTTIATSAVAMMSMLTIFWNEAYRRFKPGRYLLLLWVVSVLPLAGIALCRSPAAVLVCLMITASGMGGIHPVTADLLRSCYAPMLRSKVLGVLKAVEQTAWMLSALAVGTWLDHDSTSYRIYFPVAVVVIGAGLLLLRQITREPLFQEGARQACTEPLLKSLRGAYANMAEVLRTDERFRRYEWGFGTYGLGWMVCNALLPFVLVDLLHLDYGQVAWSTQVSFQLITILMLVPVGYLMDRVGPIRMCTWSFAGLVLYPIGLMIATDSSTVTRATVAYAIALSGVNLAWTIGPVTLARNAAHSSHYLAIHATLVAVRALVAQFPAVALYRYTGRVWIPLTIAAGLFALGSVLMARLAREREVRVPRKPKLVPAEVAAAAG